MRTGASSWSSNQGDAVEDDARGAREEARAPRETETLDAPGDAIARTLARRTESAQPPPRARATRARGGGARPSRRRAIASMKTVATRTGRREAPRRPPAPRAAPCVLPPPREATCAPRLWAGKTSDERPSIRASLEPMCARGARQDSADPKTGAHQDSPLDAARVTFSRICARRGWSRRRAPRAGARSRPDPGRGRRPSPSRDGGFDPGSRARARACDDARGAGRRVGHGGGCVVRDRGRVRVRTRLRGGVVRGGVRGVHGVVDPLGGVRDASRAERGHPRSALRVVGARLPALRALRRTVSSLPAQHLARPQRDGRDARVLRHPPPLRRRQHPRRSLHPGGLRHGPVQHRRPALPHPGGHLPHQPSHHARVSRRVPRREPSEPRGHLPERRPGLFPIRALLFFPSRMGWRGMGRRGMGRAPEQRAGWSAGESRLGRRGRRGGTRTRRARRRARIRREIPTGEARRGGRWARARVHLRAHGVGLAVGIPGRSWRGRRRARSDVGRVPGDALRGGGGGGRARAGSSRGAAQRAVRAHVGGTRVFAGGVVGGDGSGVGVRGGDGEPRVANADVGNVAAARQRSARARSTSSSTPRIWSGSSPPRER